LIQYIISTNNPVTILALPLRLHGVVIFHRAPSDRSEVWYCSRRWRCHGVLHSFCATSAVFAIQCVTVTAIYVRVSIKLFSWFLTHVCNFSSIFSWRYCLFYSYFVFYVGSYKLWVPKMRYLQH